MLPLRGRAARFAAVFYSQIISAMSINAPLYPLANPMPAKIMVRRGSVREMGGIIDALMQYIGSRGRRQRAACWVLCLNALVIVSGMATARDRHYHDTADSTTLPRVMVGASLCGCPAAN